MAEEHVRNHPRWDSDIELWLESDSPLEVGTIIHRRNHRSGSPIEGTMEVVEYEPNRAFSTLIHDGPVEMYGRITFEPEGDDRTAVTMIIELPHMDESMDTSYLKKTTGRSRKYQEAAHRGGGLNNAFKPIRQVDIKTLHNIIRIIP